MNIHRTLTPREELEFRAWARQFYIPETKIHPMWHYVVRDECERMNAEHRERQEEEGDL